MITGIFYQGCELWTNTTISAAASGVISLQGYNFSLLDGVLLSATNQTLTGSGLNSLSCVNYFTRQGPISGAPISYTVVDDNNLNIQLPTYSGACTAQFVPFNVAGWSNSGSGFVGLTGSTFIIFV